MKNRDVGADVDEDGLDIGVSAFKSWLVGGGLDGRLRA